MSFWSRKSGALGAQKLSQKLSNSTPLSKPGSRILACLVAWCVIAAPVLLGPRGIFANYAPDLCSIPMDLSHIDEGITALFFLLLRFGCSFGQLGTGAYHAYMAALLLPVAILFTWIGRDIRQIAALTGATVVYLLFFPDWFGAHRIGGMATIVTFVAYLAVIRTCAGTTRLSAQLIGLLGTAGLLLGVYFSARKSIIAIPAVVFAAGFTLVILRLVPLGSFDFRRYVALAAGILSIALIYPAVLGAVITRIEGTKMPRHSTGAPLLLGLGWTENPLNISWDDDYLAVQLRNLEFADRPGDWSQSESSEFFSAGASEFTWSLVSQFPEVIPEATIARSRYLASFLFGALDTDAHHKFRQSKILGIVILIFAIEAFLLMFFSHSLDQRRLERQLGFTALFFGVAAVPVLIAPTYLASFLAFGALYATLSAADLWDLRNCAQKFPRLRMRRAPLLGALIAVGAGAVLWAGLHTWVAHRAREALTYAQPAAFQSLWNMGHFNVLDEEAQDALLAQWRARPETYLPLAAESPVELALWLEDRVCVVARFERKHRPGLTPFLSGPRNSALLVLEADRPTPRIMKFAEDRYPAIKLPDPTWGHGQRMVCLWRPGPPTPWSGLRVEAVRFSGGEHNQGLRMQRIWNVELAPNARSNDFGLDG